jgi:hypothetical protein
MSSMLLPWFPKRWWHVFFFFHFNYPNGVQNSILWATKLCINVNLKVLSSILICFLGTQRRFFTCFNWPFGY